MRYKRGFKPMTQSDLFENVVLDITVPVRARRGDPASSHAAGKGLEKSGKLAAQRAMVFQSVKDYPGATSRELAHYANNGPIERMLVYDVFHRRLPELREAGYVQNGPDLRPCTVSGRRLLTWHPTGRQ